MRLRIFIILILSNIHVYSQTIEVAGRVQSDGGSLIEGASVRTKDNKFYIATDIRGRFRLNVPNTYNELIITALAYDTAVISLTDYIDEFVEIVLEPTSGIKEIVIHGEGINAAGDLGIDAQISKVLPSVSGGIEDLVKLNLGVTGSRNEMSSQYSVRGGNFDENLVYVNGIEVYRPQLIREGQQEGLSFINPDLVSKVRFSAGGFGAKYGDKSASVLDVTYKQPRDFGLIASGSLLGGSLSVQGVSRDGYFSYIGGLRYKNTRLYLDSSEVSGDYRPSFFDFQTYMTQHLSNQWSISLLLNAADNQFQFIPEDKDVYFGTITEVYGLFVDFEGQENNRFLNFTGATSLNFRVNEKSEYRLVLSGIKAIENETFDIYGVYSLNQIDSDFGSENAGDSLLNLGYGLYMEHARNLLNVTAYSVALNSVHKISKHELTSGIILKYDSLHDKTDEWELLDSAGYSIPYNGSSVQMYRNIKAVNSLTTNRLEAYIQDVYSFKTTSTIWEFQGGIRGNFNTYNRELLISPRGSMAVLFTGNPHYHKLRFAAGRYYQPPFYKELKQENGNILSGSTAQKSIHFIAGYELKFRALNRDLTLINELYYKSLDNFIPFELDNVRIKYLADKRARGYIRGIDAKIFGDFVVNGAESSFTISVMQTEEEVYSIANQSVEISEGYLPRATDQLVSTNLFLQDYIPGMKSFKAHLNMVFGTGFPFWSSMAGRAAGWQRSSDYKRVDLGASYVLVGADARRKFSGFLGSFKNIWFTMEVFNLLDVKNTISYSWMLVVPNTSIYGAQVQQYAVPNHLSGRRFNLKLSIEI